VALEKEEHRVATGTEFDELARKSGKTTLIGELWGMLRARKKYWLMPIVLVLLLLGVLVFLSGTAAAPFIYTLF
jgi:hypothetical protein